MSFAVNRGNGAVQGTFVVHGLAECIEHPSRYLFSHGHGNTGPCGFYLQTAGEAVCRFEGDTAADTVGKMRQHFEVYRSVAVENEQKLVLIGEMIVELYVYD